MARLEPRPDGLGLVLAAAEVDVLTSLARGLRDRIATARARPEDDDTVLAPLLPAASRGDDTVDTELRGLLREDLLTGREARLDAFVTLLAGGAAEGLDVTLDRDVAMRTVEALNDLRLALAATLPRADLAAERAERSDGGDAARLLDALAWLQGGMIEFIDPG